MLGILLSVGALNFQIVRQRLGGADSLLRSLGHFSEVEIGVGITALLLAASLTSLAPAVDTPGDTLLTSDVAARMTPRWPPTILDSHGSVRRRLQSPLILAAAQPARIETPMPRVAAQASSVVTEDKWMDDPHHWASLVIIPVGLLALLGPSKRFRYARNWPLLFPALGLILLLMSDSQYWPMGAESFWNSLKDPIVLPHRIIEVLIAVFGIFEWRVQTQRIASTNASLVFPSLVALSGAILLTHSHSAANSQAPTDLLSEASHVSIAVLGVMGGGARWLELRLPSENHAGRVLAWVWPVCFLVVGIILANYQGGS